MLVVKGARASISGNPLAKRIRAPTPMVAGLDVGNFGIIRFFLLFSSINKLNIISIWKLFMKSFPPSPKIAKKSRNAGLTGVNWTLKIIDRGKLDSIYNECLAIFE